MKEKISAFIVALGLVAWCTLIPDPSPAAAELTEDEETVEVVTSDTMPTPVPSPTKASKREGYLLVRTTYYNPVEAQCDSDPLITADGSKIDLRKLAGGNIKWIAVSPDLLVEYPLGTKVKITSRKHPEITGVYVIHDVMNPRFKYSIDILAHVSDGHVFGTHLTKMEKV